MKARCSGTFGRMEAPATQYEPGSTRPLGPVVLPILFQMLFCCAAMPVAQVANAAWAMHSFAPLLEWLAATAVAVVGLAGVRLERSWGLVLLLVAANLALAASVYSVWRFEDMFRGAVAGADAASKPIMAAYLRKEEPWYWLGAIAGLMPATVGSGVGYVWMRSALRRWRDARTTSAHVTWNG